MLAHFSSAIRLRDYKWIVTLIYLLPNRYFNQLIDTHHFSLQPTS